MSLCVKLICHFAALEISLWLLWRVCLTLSAEIGRFLPSSVRQLSTQSGPRVPPRFALCFKPKIHYPTSKRHRRSPDSIVGFPMAYFEPVW